jgi:plasmid stability protein
VRLLIKQPASRDQAITTALADPDERNVRLALGAVMQGCTAAQAAVLMARAGDDALSPDLRALGIRALASHRSMETLNFLLSRVAGSKVLVFRRSLASKSPEMLAALTGLAAHWSTEAAAKELLSQAAKSSDPEIADAATRRGGPR